MSFDNELEEFFSNDIPAVVADPEKFRRKLGIGADAFKYLKNAENLGSVITTLAGGTAAAGAVFGGWFLSLGTLGSLGLAVGLVSSPVGWVAAAGTGGAGAFFLIKRLFKGARNEAITEVPNFINSPLDILATSICEIINPILLKIAYADSNFCESEREKIRSYFINEWGINEAFVDGLLNYDESNLDSFDWDVLERTLDEIGSSGDIKVPTMANEMVRVAEEVMAADGHILPKEQLELDNLKSALGLVPEPSSEKWWSSLLKRPQKCFVATAVFEDAEHPAVQALRDYRDVVLSSSVFGRILIAAYWLVGPILSGLVHTFPLSRKVLRPFLGNLARASKNVVARH